MNHQPGSAIESLALTSIYSRDMIRAVNLILGVRNTEIFPTAGLFLNFMRNINSTNVDVIIYTEWYLDTLFSSTTIEESISAIEVLTRLASNPKVVSVAICPFGVGKEIYKHFSGRKLKILDGNLTPSHLLRVLSV